jgi:hypothetical protein
MTPKEKAIELFKKYSNPFDRNGCIPPSEALFNTTAKQCALIAVDEIIKNMPKGFYSGLRPYYKGSDLEYWQEVKQEILAL